MSWPIREDFVQIAREHTYRRKKEKFLWMARSLVFLSIQGKVWQWYMKEKAQVTGDLLLVFATSLLAISYLRKWKSHNLTTEIKKFSLTSALLLFSYGICCKIKKQMHSSNMLFIYKLIKLINYYPFLHDYLYSLSFP